MACQKYANKVQVGMMHESKGQHIGKAPFLYILFTLQLDSAWESSKCTQVHQPLYWLFMAVAMLSGHFLPQHGLRGNEARV